MLSSTSVEVEPSKSQVRTEHSEENRATGSSLVGAVSPGRSRIVHIVAAVDVGAAVPTRPPVLAGEPAGSPEAGSVSNVPNRPLPVPVVLARLISGLAAFHEVVAAFLSDQ